MKIHFGSTFGFENVYPRLAVPAGAAVIGEIQLGQKGLLEFLEMHLGVKQSDVNDALRISHYKRAIAKSLNFMNLYVRSSFEIDAWGSAQQLLRWRDQLVLALWDFECDDPDLDRLISLSVIEKYTEDMPLGVNDRWKIVYAILENKTLKLPLEELVIYENKNNIHPFFKAFFERLSEHGVKIEWFKSEKQLQDSDLSLFQRKINGEKISKKEPQKDGSLLLIRADNDKIIADCLGEYFTQQEKANPLFIIPNRGEVLEEAFVNRGKGAFGYNESIEHGAFDQLLILMSLFIWKPIDPERLVQFLLLPSGPLNKKLKQKLAKAFADKAGIGNDKWEAAIIDFCLKGHKEDLGKKFTKDGNFLKDLYHKAIEKLQKENPTFKKELKQTKDKLSYWFEREKFHPEKGANVSEVVKLYTDLKSWADKYRHSIQEDTLEQMDFKGALKKLSQQCLYLLKIIENETSEKSKVTRIKLNKWINSIHSNRVAKSNFIQRESFDYVTNPANIKSESEVIVWWNFQEEGNPLAGDPRWSASEQSVVGAERIHQPDSIVDQWYERLCNGVLNCGKQLILCVPDKIKGQQFEVNPLYRDLEACFENLHGLIYKLNFNEKKISLADTTVELIAKDKKSLPQRNTHWEINGDLNFEKKKHESFSSLSKLFFYPYAYVLNYQLGIKPINIPEVAVTPLLKGNVAHNTAELFWKVEGCIKLSPEKRKEKLKACFDEVIAEEGAIFNLKKFELSLKELETTVVDSLSHLIQQIDDNDWKFAEAEQRKYLEGSLPLTGFIDLVLTRKKNGKTEYAIVDLKWGGFARKKDEFSKEQEVQLLIYDKLLNKSGKKIYLHYYILSSKKMLSRTNGAFENAFVIDSQTSDELVRTNLWDKITNTYNGRWEELNKGLIEVGDGLYKTTIVGDSEFWKKEKILEMPLGTNKIKEEDKYSNYKNLIGYTND